MSDFSVVEAFGVAKDQPATYTAWYNEIISSGLTGALIWQAGSQLSTGLTHDDGMTVYPTGQVYSVMKLAAAALKQRG